MRRSWLALCLLIAWLAALNATRSAVVPSAWHLALNLGIAAVALGIGAIASLDRHELGLARAAVPAGLRWGGAACAAISAVVILAAAVPAARGAFEDDRTDVTAAGMALRVLVVIPLGTVLVEELVFRGVLHGLLTRLARPRVALVAGALIFGAWHVLPAWRGAADAGDAPLLVAAGTGLATSVAGAAFVWLRARSGSVVAPMLAHLATNSVVFAVAWAVNG